MKLIHMSITSFSNKLNVESWLDGLINFWDFNNGRLIGLLEEILWIFKWGEICMIASCLRISQKSSFELTTCFCAFEIQFSLKIPVKLMNRTNE